MGVDWVSMSLLCGCRLGQQPGSASLWYYYVGVDWVVLTSAMSALQATSAMSASATSAVNMQIIIESKRIRGGRKHMED